MKKKITSWALFGLYGLIMLEGILMATPFGLFLYSFYLPFLEIMRQSEWTAWVAAFFMPHSVFETSSPFLEFIRWKGPFLFFIGILGFLIFAIQIYSAKFRRKGMVNNLVYSYIRHPQYLCFMLAGIGLLFMWPRMMMLVLLTLMGMVYFYLAKFEESRMLAKHPEYAQYRQKTAMFLPGNPGGRLFGLLLVMVPNRKLAQAMVIILLLGLVMLGAVVLRNHTIAHTAFTMLPRQHILAIPTYPHDEQYMRKAVNLVLADEEVKTALDEQGRVSFTAHILPRDYGMIGMFTEIEDRAALIESFWSRKSLLGWIWGTDNDQVKLVFSKIDKPGMDYVPLDQIMDMSAKMTPVVVADLNLATGKVEKVRRSHSTYFGDVPQPIF